MWSTDVKNDLDSLVPGQSTEDGASRRTALKVALGLGYAAAAMPVMAQTAIKTSAEGLTEGFEIFDLDGATVPFYYAKPEGKANLPVIVVVQEICGVHAYITDVCRRFAKLGYLAVAPEVSVRQGDASKYIDVSKLVAEVANKVPDDQLMADLDAMVDWALANGGNAKKVGITGFCRGGRTVWMYAAYSKRVKAGVAWYGGLKGTANALTPKHPLDIAGALQAPVMGLYGGQDGGIPLTHVIEMKEALAGAAAKGNKAAAASEFVVFKDAPHAFHADYRATYRKEAAEEGFAKALAWFKAKGVA